MPIYVIMDIQPETHMQFFDSYFSARNTCKMNKIALWLLIFPQWGQSDPTERAVIYLHSQWKQDTPVILVHNIRDRTWRAVTEDHEGAKGNNRLR